jgi:ketosteroid isomerase-like protein
LTPEIDVVRRVYEAMAAKDVDQLVVLLDAECVITQDQALPWGGRHVGHDGFLSFALSLTGTIDSGVTTEALFSAGEEVFQFGRTRGAVRSNGMRFDVPEVHRWSVRDGKVVAAHFAIDTPAMLAALRGDG